MFTKGQAWSYLRKVAEARIKFIQDCKNSIELYQGDLVKIMLDEEMPVIFITPKDISELSTVKVPTEILIALDDECEEEKDFAEYIYKYVMIDGIKIRSENSVRAKED